MSSELEVASIFLVNMRLFQCLSDASYCILGTADLLGHLGEIEYLIRLITVLAQQIDYFLIMDFYYTQF